MSFSPEMEPTDCHDYSNASGEISDAGTPGKFRPLGSFDQVGDVLAAEKQNGVDKAPEEECTSAALAVDAPESDDRPQTNGEVEEKDAEQKDVHEQVEASVATIEAEPRQQLEDKISDESHVEGAKEVGVDVGDLVNSSPDEKQKGEGKVVEEIVVDMETEPKAMAPPENGTPQQNEATAKKAKRRSFLESLHFPKFDFSPGRSKQHSMATQTPHNDKEREKEYKKAKVFKEKKPKEKKQKHKDKKTKSSEPKSPVTSEPDTEKKDLDETDEGKNNVDSKDLCKEEEPVEVAKTTDDEPVSLNNKEEDISAIEWDLEKQMRLVEEEFAKLDEVAGDFCLDDEQSNDALATTPEKDDQPTHMVTFDDKKPAEDDVPKDKSVQFQKPEGGDDEIIMAVVVEREIIQPEMAQVQIEKHDTSSTSSISSEENKETPEVTINVEDTDEDKQKPDTEPEAVIVVPSTSDVKATDSSKEKIKEDKGKKKEKKEKQKKILKSKDRNKDKKTTTETGLVVVGKDERPISVSSISTDDTKESNTSKEGTLEKGKKKKEKAVKKKTPKEEKKKKDKKEKDDKKVKAPVKEEASHSSKESGETKEDLPKPVKVQKREKKKPSKEKEKNRKSVIETGLVVVEVPSKVSDDQVVSSGRIEAPSDQENVVSEPQKCEEENVIAVVSPDKVDEQEKIDVSDPEKTAVVGPDEVDNQEKAEVREPEKTEDDSIIAVVIPDEIDDQENMEVYEPEKFEEEKIIAIVHPEGVDELEKVEISEPEKPDEENLIATVSPDEVDDQEKVDIIEPEQLEISDPEKLEISEPEKLEISEPEENVIAVVSPEEVEDLKEIGEPEKEEAAIKVVSPEIDQEIVEKEEPEKVEVLPVKVEKEKRKIKIHKKKHKEEKKKNKEEKTKPKEEEKKPKEVIETGLVVVDEGGRPLSITSINSEEITEHDTTKESPDAEKEEKHKESPKKKTKEGKKDKKDKAEKKKKRKSQQDDKEQEITIKKEIIVKAEVEVEPSEEQKKEKHKKIEAKTEKKSPDKKEEKKGKKRKDKEQATSEKTEHGKRRKAEKDTPKKKKDSSWKLKHKEKRKAEKSADAENPASPTSPTSISSFEDPDATKSDVDTTRSDDELRPLSITSFSSDTDQPTTDGETSRPVSHVTVPEGGDHLVSPDGSQPGTCSDDIEIRPLSPISISSDSSVRPASQVITDEELKKPETKQPKTHKFRTFPRSSTPKKPKRKDRYKDRRSLDAEDITSYMVEPSIPKNLPEPASKHHRVVVAIDFGTTFSGYAYSFTNDPEYIHIMRKWEGGDPGVTNMKTPTTLLMTSDGHFHSFGFSARDFYHDLDHSEAKKWLYFDKFKMTLHTSQDLSNKTELTAVNGKRKPAIEVFSHALRFFKEHALQELNDQLEDRIENEDIRWVITVPAIWKQPAKQFMREAAYKAGISSKAFPEQLLIALEPEAASIYIRKMKLHEIIPDENNRLSHYRSGCRLSIGPINVDFMHGTKYMVVDCGGGTVDITVHELEEHLGTLKELHKAAGGEYGSVSIDKAFEDLLDDIFTKEFLDEFKMKRPAGWVDLMIAFEARKRNASPWKNNPLNVSLPFSFIDYYKKYTKNRTVEIAVKKFGDKDVTWSSQGMLRFTPEGMRRLFLPTLDHIRQEIELVLQKPSLDHVNYLFLVGGFAESPLLQEEIRKSFKDKLRVIIPQDVGLTILKGAVLYGIDPNVVRVRRSPLTYGVGVLNKFIRGKHPEEKLIVKDEVEWCSDIFDTFTLCDQPIAVGEFVTRSYTPAKPNQKSTVINMYCSDKQRVRYLTDEGVKKCGTLHIDMSDSTYMQLPRRREIQITMLFGDTEIKVSALDVATGNCVKADIDFFKK